MRVKLYFRDVFKEMDIKNYSEYKIKGGTPRHLVILLHGYGSNKDDLITIAPELAKSIPDAHFISPNAPFEFEGGLPNAFQWFSLIDRTYEKMLKGARLAAEILKPFIFKQLERFGLSESNLALVGFSQGAMLSIHITLSYDLKPKCIIGYSGAFIPDQIKQKHSNILLVHGQDDEVVPFSKMEDAKRLLTASGITVRSIGCQNLAHGINKEGIEAGAEFLKDCFK